MFAAKTTFDGKDHLRGDQCLHMGFTSMNDGGEFYAIIYAGKPATISGPNVCILGKYA